MNVGSLELPTEYHLRLARLALIRDDHTTRWNRLGNLRLISFVLLAFLAGWALWTGSWRLLVPALAAGVWFVWLIRAHRLAGRQKQWASALHDLNAEALLRDARDWQALPIRHSFRADPQHPYAADLDLFGPASLFHLLETVETPLGELQLREWLLGPASPMTIEARQSAVATLAPELDWRQQVAAHGRLIGREKPDPEPFLSWAEQQPLLRGRRWLIWAARAGTVALVLTAAVDIAGLLTLPLWILAAVFNLAIVQIGGSEIRGRLRIVAEQHRAIACYADLLETIETMPSVGPLLVQLRDSLRTADASATEELDRLRSISAWVVPPSSILYLALQAIAAWDLQVLGALERWQHRVGSLARGWLETLGEVEALCALAALSHDNPNWVYPTIDQSRDRFSVTTLGHPLIPAESRVTNDVEVGPPGTFLLVTGSNMSGKSTLLRSIGVNAVLAQAGGPVCASRFTLPPVVLWTSVRVQDSLAEGVSFFLAELKRLKSVVDGATETRTSGGVTLYLLDEIMQGTNSAERQIAARRVIRALIDAGAIGAVSTHDLALADGPELAGATEAVHFRETILPAADGATQMTFDYLLRPGIATSTNALQLMDIVFGRSEAEIPQAVIGA